MTFPNFESMHRLFHVSEDPAIKTFVPRPSPSAFEAIRGDVVFAICDRLLHNYFLPRDCPRVCYYAGGQSTADDIDRLIGPAGPLYVMAIESKWRPVIERTTIYCYELPGVSFSMLDACAGYFISYEAVTPVSVKPVDDLLAALSARQVELRFLDRLRPLADEVRASTLNFSLIRMRNAE